MSHFFIASKNFHTGRSGKNKKKSGKKPTFFHLLLVTSSGLHLFKNLLRWVWGKSGVPNRMKQLSTLYLIVFPLFGRSKNSMAGEPKKKEKRFAWQNADEGMRRKISDFLDFSEIWNFFRKRWKQGPKVDLMLNFEKTKISIFPNNRQ